MAARIFTSVAAIALTAGCALAADLPSRKAPPVAPPPPPPALWTGFYAGVNAGYTFSDSQNVNLTSLSLSPAAPIVAWAAEANGVYPTSNNGFIGGGQIGYNNQFGSVVAGFEADIPGLASNGGRSTTTIVAPFAANTFFSTNQVSKSIDYLGTVRGRLGYLVTPTLLIYGTGGFAYGGVQTSASVFQFSTLNGFFGAGDTRFSDLRTGWTAGGGGEWMFLPNWSAKVEYLYYNLGNQTSDFTLFRPAGPFAVSQASTRFDGHIVRAGLNYHLNWGAAPIVAKY
jgi:outer membrane immunogenic protein